MWMPSLESLVPKDVNTSRRLSLVQRLVEEAEEVAPEEQIDVDIADPNGDAEPPQIEEGETDIPEEVDELHVLWCAIRTLGDGPAPPSSGDLLPILVNLFLISEEVPSLYLR